MPAKPKLTPAERMRRHREAFTLALELRITPASATKIIEARAAMARAIAAQARLNALTNAPLRTREPTPAPMTNTTTECQSQWWNRD